MNLVFRLLRIEKILEQFVERIEQIGWWRASEAYMADLGIKVENRLGDFPKRGGVLVYANHPTGLDPFILSSVLGRDDVYFLSDVYHAKKGRSVQEHMIPVYYSSWKELWERSGLAFLGFVFMRLTNGFSSLGIAREKNREAIETAVQRLLEGHVVLVFPSGGSNEKRPWKRGIGEILLRMKDNSFVLYRCRIFGITELGLVRHFMGGRHYLREQSGEVTGSRKDQSFLSTKTDSVDLTRYLQSNFFTVG